MSALPPEADMLIVGINVCFLPEADIRGSLAKAFMQCVGFVPPAAMPGRRCCR